HAGKKLVSGFRRDDGVESMLHVVGIVEKSSFRDIEIPYLLNRRVESHHRKRERSIFVLHRGIFLRHAHYMAAEGHVITQQFDVVIGEPYDNSGLVASRLLRSAARKDSHGSGAEAFKNSFDGFPEA